MALRNYQEATEERKRAFEELKTKDEKSAKEIDLQMRKLQRITVTMFPTDSLQHVNAKSLSTSPFSDLITSFWYIKIIIIVIIYMCQLDFTEEDKTHNAMLTVQKTRLKFGGLKVTKTPIELEEWFRLEFAHDF